MKYGIRTPSVKRSVKAMTTGRVKRAVKKEINPLYGTKAMGVIRNPEKAVYNRVYDKTTVGTGITGTVIDAVTDPGKGKAPKTAGKNADENKTQTDKPAEAVNDPDWVDYTDEQPKRKVNKRLVEEYTQHPEYADKDRKIYLVYAIICLITCFVTSYSNDYICTGMLIVTVYCLWHRRTIRKAKEAAAEAQNRTQ